MAVKTADFILPPLHDVFTLEQLTWLQVHHHQLSDAVNAEIREGSTLVRDHSCAAGAPKKKADKMRHASDAAEVDLPRN